MFQDILHQFISPITGKLREISQLPDIPKGQIITGDENNKPIISEKITLTNLPPLHHATVAGLETPFPQVYGGTADGTVEVSNALGDALADLVTVNARFLTGNFIMGTGNAIIKTAMAASTFLDTIESGILYHDIGVVRRALPGTDYIDIEDGIIPDSEKLPIWSSEPGRKLLTNSDINILNGNDLRNVGTIDCVLLAARNAITSEQNIIARTSLEGRQLILYDYDDIHRYQNYSSFNGAYSVAESIVMDMPDLMPTEYNDYVLSITNVVNLIDISGKSYTRGQLKFIPQQAPLNYEYLLMHKPEDSKLPNAIGLASLEDGFLAKITTGGNAHIETFNKIPFDKLPDLLKDKIWIGDNANRPIEKEVSDFAPSDAKFVLLEPHNALPKSQALSQATQVSRLGNIVKYEHDPIFGSNLCFAVPTSILYPDAFADYVTPATLNKQIELLTGAGTLAGLAALLTVGTTLMVYDEYLFKYKYKPLASEMKYYDSQNLTNSGDHIGKGQLWIDHDGNNDNSRKPGFQVISYDSSYTTWTSNPIAPTHIGVFGYKDLSGPHNETKGFIWQAHYDNDTGSNEYRFPIKFDLSRVTHIESNNSWYDEEKILSYTHDNKTFTHSKKTTFKENVKFEGTWVRLPVSTTILNIDVSMDYPIYMRFNPVL